MVGEDRCKKAMEGVAVMDRAYERRRQLLEESSVKGVAMMLDPHGVTLTIARKNGGYDVEFLPKGAGE
jgi:hypothetical protein